MVAELDDEPDPVCELVLGAEFGATFVAEASSTFGAVSDALDIIVLSYTETGMSKITCILL